MILYLIKKFLGINSSFESKQVVFELGQNDLLVLHCKEVLSMEQVEYLRKHITEALSSESNTKCIALPYNMDYSIIKRR